MIKRSMRGLAVPAVAIALVISGCSSSSGGAGGDTSCGDYLGQSADSKADTIRDYMRQVAKAEGVSTDELNEVLTDGSVALSIQAFDGYCQLVGDDAKLNSIETFGG